MINETSPLLAGNSPAILSYEEITPAERIRTLANDVYQYITRDQNKYNWLSLVPDRVAYLPHYQHIESHKAYTEFFARKKNNQLTTEDENKNFIYAIFTDGAEISTDTPIAMRKPSQNGDWVCVPVQALLEMLDKFKNDLPSATDTFSNNIQSIRDEHVKTFQVNESSAALGTLGLALFAFLVSGAIAGMVTALTDMPDEFYKVGAPENPDDVSWSIEGNFLSAGVYLYGSGLFIFTAMNTLFNMAFGKKIPGTQPQQGLLPLLSEYGNSLALGSFAGMCASIFSAKHIDGLTKSRTNDLGAEYVSGFTDMGALYVVGLMLLATIAAAGMQRYSNASVTKPLMSSKGSQPDLKSSTPAARLN